MLEAKFDKSVPNRLVIDPISMLRASAKSDVEYKRDLLLLIGLLRKHGVTTLLTSDVYENGMEDYLVSGVIELHVMDVRGKIVRGMRVSKMRGSDFDEVMRPYRIVRGGIVVYDDLNIFEDVMRK